MERMRLTHYEMLCIERAVDNYTTALCYSRSCKGSGRIADAEDFLLDISLIYMQACSRRLQKDLKYKLGARETTSRG